MNRAPATTTRREFLRQIAAAAAASTLGSAADCQPTEAEKGDRSRYKVFTEGRIGSLRIKNRFVRAAAIERAAADGGPTDAYLKIMGDLATGGVGLIITGAMAAGPSRMPTQMLASEDRHIAGLRRIPEIVHAADGSCRIMAQAHRWGDVGPSGIPWRATESVRAMSVAEIEEAVRQFAESIRRFREAGFDGAELNGHFTYLLSSFLSPLTNKRDDAYGGSIEKRVRIVREIVAQARTKVGADFPILIKVNCDDSFSADATSEEGTNLGNFHLVAAELEKAGVDAIEVSGNTLLRKNVKSPEGESYYLKYAETLRLSIPVILTGGNRSIERMEEIIEGGKVDFFGLGRPLIREPGLVRRWREGRGSAQATCISCSRCVTDKAPLRCMQEVEPDRSE
jgi:2,4-dienoyl-CoA reductase-like NADH-dependent reductase (Old Yellow Enzyme family)